MKNSLLLIVLVLFSYKSNAQYFHEDFENPDSVFSTSTTGLGGFHLNNRLQTSGINSDSAAVIAGDTSYLITLPFDASAATNLFLTFKHICKIDFFDKATVWIQSSTFGIYDQLTAAQMIDQGEINAFTNQGSIFQEATWGNAWLPGVDTLPDNSWWKKEVFDFSAYSGVPDLQIIFQLEDANGPGGNGRAGWFIDDINIDYSFYGTPHYTLNNYSNCVLPQSLTFNLSDFVVNYPLTDTITTQFFFGDGTDTTFSSTLQQLIDTVSFSHIYILPGLFSTHALYTLSNGTVGSSTYYNNIFLGDSCSNISGHVFGDCNLNCMKDNNDIPLSYKLVKLKYNGQVIKYAFTDSAGYYQFDVPTNSYEIVIDSTILNNTTTSIFCPPTGYYSVINYPSLNNDFALDFSQSDDLSTFITDIQAVPVNQSTFHLRSNYEAISACNLVNTQAILVFDSAMTFINSFPAPSIVSNDTLFWTLNNFNPGVLFSPYIILSANNSGLNIGDTVCFTSLIAPFPGESNLINNISTECYPITSSCDPNYKLVKPEGNISQTQQLNYTINFQNTGTAPAHNVFILDTISQNLDLNTLQILCASHNMTVDFLPNNLLKINFNNIMLPDSNANEPASHGYVAYSIKPKPNLVNGTTITNDSHIYFDWNLPVATNYTLNIIDTTITTGIVAQVNQAEEFSVFPNPANDFVTLTIDKSHFKDEQVFLEIINSIGEKVTSKKINSESTSINIKNLPSGIYLFHLISGNKIFENRKVIKY